MSRDISNNKKQNWREILGKSKITYPIERRKSRAVKIGDVIIGGNFPIAIQSMTTTDTRDIEATVKQIEQLEEAGCEIVRVAVLNKPAAECLGKIKKQIKIPLVADIHFSHNLALIAIAQGVDKVRINPGNIGPDWKVAEVVKAAKDAEIPIRIGVNSGSLPQDLLDEFGHEDPRAFVGAALRELETLDKHDFHDTVISLKSTNASCAIFAYRMLAELVDYPFHLGITEAGTEFTGSIKSAVGIGSILSHGIGDTLRVSLTADPVKEIRVCKQILTSLALKKDGVEVISCPTCGRCQIDLIPLANRIEENTRHIKKPMKVAVMGCVVNGPGEAKAADIGIAGGLKKGILFTGDKTQKTYKEDELEEALMKEIEKLAAED
ncbi:MAG: flavodoxin-dependent (E)-4-hydroxy-3-methylbut-2-enyl-diphosphate synthase [candidate division Zixibacteria bacterium]|nr:flavodoxin-dependent (E)-4-hydroxy-3-methylbut-2-enyl-diphosphate synthase [candidate division Zixibacteria bacterium]